jgi:hypothetical protein
MYLFTFGVDIHHRKEMKTPSPLFLHEEVLLLALRDREGTIEMGSWYGYAVGGAILAELLLHQRIEIVQQKKSKLVNLISDQPVGDPLIDECLKKIREAKRRATVQTWVSRIASTVNLKHRVATQLCRKGILKEAEDKVLLIFSRKIYPEIDPNPEKALIERLHKAIFTDTDEVEPRTAILLSLVHSVGLLKMAFDKKKLKERKKRIEQVVNGEITGMATQEAIQSMQTVLMVTCIMPTILTTTVIHS